ncbi:MAG TPA: hypothetical protein VF273_00450 [Pelobium sp.]
MRKIKIVSFFLGCCTIFFGCSEPQKQVKNQQTMAKPVLPAPFKKHLKVEVGPDVIFDVFAWGRGSDSTSSILVLRSDSLKNDFSVASTDNLDGKLEEVFNTDMDKDSNPEIVIYYTKNDKYKTADILCYEFNGKTANKITFPELTNKTQKQYRGADKFYVKGGELYREFDVFSGDAKDNKPVGKKFLKYFLKGNKFDLNELEN